MRLDDFSPLAGEAEVASVVLVLVQLAHTRGKVGVGKAHPVVLQKKSDRKSGYKSSPTHEAR